MARQPKDFARDAPSSTHSKGEQRVIHEQCLVRLRFAYTMWGWSYSRPQQFQAGSPMKTALLQLRYEEGAPLWLKGEPYYHNPNLPVVESVPAEEVPDYEIIEKDF